MEIGGLFRSNLRGLWRSYQNTPSGSWGIVQILICVGQRLDLKYPPTSVGGISDLQLVFSVGWI